MRTVLVLNRDQMGSGDAELGRKILITCLRKLPKFEGLEAIVLYNGGVKLATKTSPAATELNWISLLATRAIGLFSPACPSGGVSITVPSGIVVRMFPSGRVVITVPSGSTRVTVPSGRVVMMVPSV